MNNSTIKSKSVYYPEAYPDKIFDSADEAKVFVAERNVREVIEASLVNHVYPSEEVLDLVMQGLVNAKTDVLTWLLIAYK